MFDLSGKTIFITGHRGMLGSAVVRRLASEDCKVLTAERAELDLTDQQAIDRKSPGRRAATSAPYICNLDAKRDWGHARDYAEGMWMILQHPEPDDFVLATGETHSVREFIELAFGEIDVEIRWDGRGTQEMGTCAKTGRVLVKVDSNYFRPTEFDLLLGDPSKARTKLGWTPKIAFHDLVKEMVASDIEAIRRR